MLFTFCFFTVFLLDFLVKFCIDSNLSTGFKSLCSYTFLRKYINIHKEVKVYLEWNICRTLEGINYPTTLNSVDWGEVNGKLLHLECLKKQKFELLGLFAFDPCLEFATVTENVIAMKCANWLPCLGAIISTVLFHGQILFVNRTFWKFQLQNCNNFHVGKNLVRCWL